MPRWQWRKERATWATSESGCDRILAEQDGKRPDRPPVPPAAGKILRRAMEARCRVHLFSEVRHIETQSFPRAERAPRIAIKEEPREDPRLGSPESKRDSAGI